MGLGLEGDNRLDRQHDRRDGEQAARQRFEVAHFGLRVSDIADEAEMGFAATQRNFIARLRSCSICSCVA